jgi:hypothetical protein
MWARVHRTCNVAIEVFKNHPLQIKEIADDIEHCKEEFGSFLYSNSFYLGVNVTIVMIIKILA